MKEGKTSEANYMKKISNHLKESSANHTDLLNHFIKLDSRDDFLKFIRPNETTHVQLARTYITSSDYTKAASIIAENEISVSGNKYRN